MSWESYYLLIAEAVSLRSKDPATKVGCVIVAGNMHSIGYNGFPRKVEDLEDRWQRPMKYDYVVHAELNAILSADLQAIKMDNLSTMYTTHDPCPECAKAIIQCGIKKIVSKGMKTSMPEEKMILARDMLIEAGVQLYWIS